MHSVAERYLRRRTGHQEAQFQMVDSAGASNVCSHWIQAAEVTELRGHDGRVFDLAFCPVYSGLLASASDDNTVRLWQVADADRSEASKQMGVCQGHKDSVLRVTWHKEGQLIVSASADTTAQLWRLPQEQTRCADLCEGDSVQTLQGHPEEVYACEFLATDHLLTASADKLFLWDVHSGNCLQELSGSQELHTNGQMPERWQPGYIFSARPQPGGSLVATACSDGVMRVWDLRSGQLQSVCSLPLHEGMAAACAWDAQGHCIASVATNGDITALEIRTQRKVWSATAACGLRDCCYLPNSMDNVDCLVAAGIDGALHVCQHPENQEERKRETSYMPLSNQEPLVGHVTRSSVQSWASAVEFADLAFFTLTEASAIKVNTAMPDVSHSGSGSEPDMRKTSQGGNSKLHSCQSQVQSLLCVNTSKDGTSLAAAGGSGKVREVHSHATSQQAQSLATKENDQFLIKVYSQADVVCI